MYTPFPRQAGIIRTRIAVVAIRRLPVAHAEFTDIVRRAKTAVIARHVADRGICTPGRNIAGILCTGIMIITVHRLPAADAVVAGVLRRADIIIIAGSPVQRVMCAPCFRITSVPGALIAVIAIRRSTCAKAVRAGVPHRTRITVVTGHSIQRLMQASGNYITFVFGALIAVIAIRRRTLTNAVHTDVLHRAGIAVVTGYSVQRLIEASRFHVAFILCAMVPVVTDYGGPGAGPVSADVVCRTCIRIIAGNSRQRLMGASHNRNAFILGAGIPVIAVHRDAGAGPVSADVVCRADIVVIAWEPVFFTETHI
jgi:hypothetical protein